MEEEDKKKNSELHRGVSWLREYINSKQKTRKLHLDYNFVRNLVTGNLREAENNIVKAVNLVREMYDPNPPSVAPPSVAPVVAPVVAPTEEANPDELLLRRFYRMKLLSDLQASLDRGNPHKSISEKVWKDSIMEKYDKLKKDLDELGGDLTQEEENYVRTIPDAVMKVHKLKVTGKGRSKKCLKCGLLK